MLTQIEDELISELVIQMLGDEFDPEYVAFKYVMEYMLGALKEDCPDLSFETIKFILSFFAKVAMTGDEELGKKVGGIIKKTARGFKS